MDGKEFLNSRRMEMRPISEAMEKVLDNQNSSQEQPSSMDRKRNSALQILKNPSLSVTENGVNALDLIPSEPLTAKAFADARAVLQANYGTEYSDEKMALLFDLLRDDEWSNERFMRTLKWFMKSKPFPSWTVADWFAYSVKVFPYSWYVEQCTKGRSAEIEAYVLHDKTVVYKFRDGVTLPFQRQTQEMLQENLRRYLEPQVK